VRADRIVARARACLGTAFRPQGRRPEWGLDCIGLVAFAIEADGVPFDYTLRGEPLELLNSGLERAGLGRVPDARPGDILVIRAGPEQLHLGILTQTGLIHADAGLRRVVERPGAFAWPVLSAWRALEQEEI